MDVTPEELEKAALRAQARILPGRRRHRRRATILPASVRADGLGPFTLSVGSATTCTTGRLASFRSSW